MATRVGDGRKQPPGRLIEYPDGTYGWADDTPDFSMVPAALDALEAAKQMRDRLLAKESWYTSEQLAALWPADELTRNRPDEYTARLRSTRRLLGVRFRERYLHPATQFLPTGDPHPAMADVLKYLPHTDANWDAAFWWFQPTGFLFEPDNWVEVPARRPADVFLLDPQRVVDAAKNDFVPGDDRW